MEKRSPAELPGRLTVEVILYSHQYDLHHKAELHRQEMESSPPRRDSWWKRLLKRSRDR